MSQCTPMGCGDKPGLPLKELNLNKQALFKLCPDYWGCPAAFEPVWADSVDAIGQACKRSR